MVKSILVPLDGSPFGEQALPMAVGLAKSANASIQLLHVHSPMQASYAEIQLYDASLEQHLIEREKNYLEDAGNRVAQAASVPVTTFNKEGEVADVIEDHVESNGVDLVVLSTHARGAMGRFWLGSVADELIHVATAPLLLVHPSDKPQELTQPLSVKQILVPLDGSPLAEQILPAAMAMAKTTGASISLLRVISPVMMATLPMGMGTVGETARTMAEQVDKIHTTLKAEASAYLDTVAKKATAEGIKTDIHVAIDDQAGMGVIHYVENAKVDMIAMETHGRGGLARMFLGSTANKVLRGSMLPLLLQRGKE